MAPEHKHWNYFGADENLGPVAVSIRREKPEDMKENGSPYNYRIIFRTSELMTLRRPSYTLGMKSLHGEFSASDSSLTDIQETRRQPIPDPGLMPLPDAASDLDWSNLVDAAKAYEVQRASFFAASDENHRPLSAASNSDQLEEQALVQMKSYSSKDPSPTLASKVDQLEGMLKMLREDLKKEKEDKAQLQAEVEHLREDNLRLQEESQNASDKLKKFTEWVFNTIDMS